MSSDPVNKGKSQQPKKEVLGDELEGYLSSIKTIDWYKQVWKPNLKPWHNLHQSYRESKYI